MTSRVVLYTRPDCHLCEDARVAVAAACEDAGVEWQELDVDSDPHTREAYGEKIPVVTVDGQVCGFWRIDATTVRQALAT